MQNGFYTLKVLNNVASKNFSSKDYQVFKTALNIIRRAYKITDYLGRNCDSYIVKEVKKNEL